MPAVFFCAGLCEDPRVEDDLARELSPLLEPGEQIAACAWGREQVALGLSRLGVTGASEPPPGLEVGYAVALTERRLIVVRVTRRLLGENGDVRTTLGEPLTVALSAVGDAKVSVERRPHGVARIGFPSATGRPMAALIGERGDAAQAGEVATRLEALLAAARR